jgi:hypothetical protein
MDESPYDAPATRDGEAVEKLSDGALVLRAVAFICWGVCLLLVWPVYRFAVVLSEVPPTFISPIFTWPLAIAMLPLPFAGFLILGFAAWYGSRWLAMLGAWGFIPLPLYLAYAALAGFA